MIVALNYIQIVYAYHAKNKYIYQGWLGLIYSTLNQSFIRSIRSLEPALET